MIFSWKEAFRTLIKNQIEHRTRGSAPADGYVLIVGKSRPRPGLPCPIREWDFVGYLYRNEAKIWFTDPGAASVLKTSHIEQREPTFKAFQERLHQTYVTEMNDVTGFLWFKRIKLNV